MVGVAVRETLQFKACLFHPDRSIFLNCPHASMGLTCPTSERLCEFTKEGSRSPTCPHESTGSTCPTRHPLTSLVTVGEIFQVITVHLPHKCLLNISHFLSDTTTPCPGAAQVQHLAVNRTLLNGSKYALTMSFIHNRGQNEHSEGREGSSTVTLGLRRFRHFRCQMRFDLGTAHRTSASVWML